MSEPRHDSVFLHVWTSSDVNNQISEILPMPVTWIGIRDEVYIGFGVCAPIGKRGQARKLITVKFHLVVENFSVTNR